MPRIWKYVILTLIGCLIILFVCAGAFVFLLMWLFPLECDEGIARDRNLSNTRGDVVSSYLKACTSLGTFVDYSIVLQLHDKPELITLAYHTEINYDYPKFRWATDNELIIELGRVSSVWSKIDHVSGIHITYNYLPEIPDR